MSYLTQKFLDGMTNQVEEEMLEGLIKEFKTMFPKRCRILGDENLNLFLTHQQERAKYYNYLYYDDLKRYAFIAFYLGTYFDEDELYPWVQEIVQENESFGKKVDKLNHEFYIMFDEVIGEDSCCLQKAFLKLRKVNIENIKTYKKYGNIINALNYIYPQRMKMIGKKNFEENLTAQKDQWDRYDIHVALGASVYGALVFFLGSKVDKDPLYPWVSKYLNQTLVKEEKVEILLKKSMNRVHKAVISIKKSLEKES